MINVNNRIRSLYAYTLLLVLALQWFAGSMFIKMTCLVEVTTEMNAAEQEIALSVMSQYGFDAHVKVVEEEDLERIQGLGYAAPFVHAVELNGTLSTFTLEDNPTDYQQMEITIHDPGKAQHDQQSKQCVEKLFTQFYIEGQNVLPSKSQSGFTTDNFSVIILHDIFHHANPSPPPRLI